MFSKHTSDDITANLHLTNIKCYSSSSWSTKWNMAAPGWAITLLLTCLHSVNQSQWVFIFLWLNPLSPATGILQTIFSATCNALPLLVGFLLCTCISAQLLHVQESFSDFLDKGKCVRYCTVLWTSPLQCVLLFTYSSLCDSLIKVWSSSEQSTSVVLQKQRLFLFMWYPLHSHSARLAADDQ